jgi:hypothetical protein
MPSQIECRYGVPLPIEVLWRELETRYGSEVVAELQTLYRAATKRYSRASELNRRRRLVRHWDQTGQRSDLCARYKESLADPQAFIDREE